MRASSSESPDWAWTPTEAESIALAYYRAHQRDGWAALVHVIEDALADLAAADSAIRTQGLQISLGYVRGGRPPAARPTDGGLTGRGRTP